MKAKSLSAEERKLLVTKAIAAQRPGGELGAWFFEDLSDDGLWLFANDFTPEESEERERNSGWIEDMEGEEREKDRLAGRVAPSKQNPAWLEQYASPCHLTAGERIAKFLGLKPCRVPPLGCNVALGDNSSSLLPWADTAADRKAYLI